MDKIEVPFFTDKAGQEVFRGDYIVYGKKRGDSSDLGVGKVVNIKVGDGWNANELWSITIIALDYDYANQKHVVADKKVNLQFPRRILKTNFMADAFKDLLDGQ